MHEWISSDVISHSVLIFALEKCFYQQYLNQVLKIKDFISNKSRSKKRISIICKLVFITSEPYQKHIQFESSVRLNLRKLEMLTLFCNFIKCWDYDILISECISADALFNKVPRKSEQIIFSSKWGSSLGQICESFGFAMSSINLEDVVRKVKNPILYQIWKIK